jgi:CRP/FNR family transcriptional regulator
MSRAELFPFLAGLSPPARKELGALAELRASPGQVLLSRGDDAQGAFLVLQGALRVYYLTEEGREATLYRVEPGSTCVLALSATLRSQPYPAWVEAAPRGVRFVRVPREAFHRLVEEEGAFRDFVLEALSGRIFELMSTLEQLATSTVVQRVAGYVARQAGAGGEVGATQAMIAAELGTAREVVFRALRGLAAQGLVATARGRVRVLDPRGLAHLAAGGR